MHIGQRLTTIYDAAFATDRWRPALDVIQDGTTSVGLMFFDVGHDRQITYEAHGISSSYSWVTRHLEEYNQMVSDPERGSGIDAEGTLEMHAKPTHVAVLDEDIWALNDEYRARPEIQFTRDKLKYYRRFFVNLSDDPLSYSTLLAHYSVDHQGPLPIVDLKHVQGLSPHFGKALELNRTLHGLRTKYNAVLSVLDRIDTPILIVDAKSSVILENQRAASLLAQRDGVRKTRQGQLAGDTAELTDELRYWCKHIAMTARGDASVSTFWIEVPRRAQVEPLFVVVSPLRDAEVELERGLTGALITVLDGAQTEKLRFDIFSQAYNLTKAEGRVLKHLVHGLTNIEIGERLNVKPETIKSQVSSILTKTNARSRVGVAWRVFQFLPPIT